MEQDATANVAPASIAAEESAVRLSLSLALAEFVGTFVLVFVACGGSVFAVLAPGDVTSTGRALADGLTVMVLTYAFSNVSGAHFNPVVTLGFTLRRVFPARHLLPYWLMQLGGAVLAAFLLRVLFGERYGLGAPSPAGGGVLVLVMEGILTFIRIAVLLSVATRHKVIGPTAALASGGTVALLGLFARPVSGAAANPARVFGPALVGGHLESLGPYVLGPLVGTAVAALVVALIHPHHHRSEVGAASGDRQAPGDGRAAAKPAGSARSP